MLLSIVIPCYNEVDNIPLILDKFNQVIKEQRIEVILVNNGSTDNSSSVLETLLPTFPFARTVLVPVNKGYGYGIIQGLKEAKGDFLGWTHADMQTDPKDVLKAYHILQKYNWDKKLYIKGNRKNRLLFDRIFTMGMSVFETIYMGKRLQDVNAQPNIFSRDFFDLWKNPPMDFSLDLYALYMARINNEIIIRFDVLFPPRIYGSSHWNTGIKSKCKFIKRTVSFSRSLKKMGVR